MIEKIVSGGQTGVDRAALDVAITMDIIYGGWCPKGRLDECGVIPDKYNNLKEIEGNFETEKQNYDARTKLNITDSDGTLIFVPGIPLPTQIKDGTLLTISEVAQQQKPFFLVDLSNSEKNLLEVLKWIRIHRICVLNIAGPRESNCEGIYQASYSFLCIVIQKLQFSSSYR